VSNVKIPLPLLKEDNRPYNELNNQVICDYEVRWDDGEVEWEMVNVNYHEQPDYKNENNYEQTVTYSAFITPMEIKYFEIKNKLIDSILTNAVISGIEKGLYEELSKLDSLLLETTNFVYDNMSGNGIQSDIITIFISILIGLNYKKNNVKNMQMIGKIEKMKKIEKLEKINETEINTTNYLKIRKFSSIVFIIFLSVFTKNIKIVL
jgi:hypothetical protein